MRRLSDIDLRLLRIFVAVVECGGITKATSALNLAQSTLSSHIANLENRLGSRLCERGRGGFKLTRQGEETYLAIKELLGGMDRFDVTIRRIHGRSTERLRIGIVDVVTTNKDLALPEAIGRFCAAHPQVFLDIDTLPPEQLQQAVLNNRRDVIVGTSLQHVQGLIMVELAPEDHLLYCGRAHPWFDREDSTLQRDEFQRTQFSVRSYQFFDDTYRLGNITASASVSSMEAQELLILSGHYIGFLPRHKGDEWAAKGAMRAVLPNVWLIRSRFVAAYDAAAGTRELKAAFVRALIGAA